MAETKSPAQLVTDTFEEAKSYANNLKEGVNSFVKALYEAVGTPPTIAFTWEAQEPPELPTIGEPPTMPSIDYVSPGTAPDVPDLPTPDIVIDPFTDAPPDTTFPAAPQLWFGSAPDIPTPDTVAVPDAPTVTVPDVPALLSIEQIAFNGLDAHESWWTKLEEIPTLTLLAPTPYSYTPPSREYTDGLMAALQAKLAARLEGGTGLTPAVEQAIWDRARSRETKTALANEASVLRQSEAMGFMLPSGVVAAQLREVQQDYYDKMSSLSRDVAIKQAELEQENLKTTITQVIQLEGQLIDYAYKIEALAFESAKELAQNAVQIYNAQVENFKALLDGYRTYAMAYDTIIKGELAKVEAYKAQIEGERTKAVINQTTIEAYKAQIQANLAQVEIFRAQVGAAQTLIELEKTKLQAAGEQIRAYVAQINGETAKVEAYKAGVQAEVAKTDVFRARVAAYAAKVGAQADKARAEISRYVGLTQAYTARVDGYRAVVGAESARVGALATVAQARTELFKADTQRYVAQADVSLKKWTASIHQYEASKNIGLATEKINADVLIQNTNAHLRAAEVGAQVQAQLMAAALTMQHVSASVQGSSSNSVMYQYGGDVGGTVDAVPLV